MYSLLPLLQYTPNPSSSASTKSRAAAEGVGGTAKVREETGMSNLAGRFLFKTVPFGEVDEAEEEAENTVGGLGRRSRNGEEGEEDEEAAAEGEEQDDVVEELEGLRCERESERDSGEEEMMEGFEQKREEEGENTGELETATEQDMFYLTNVGGVSSAKKFNRWNWSVCALFFFVLLCLGLACEA